MDHLGEIELLRVNRVFAARADHICAFEVKLNLLQNKSKKNLTHFAALSQVVDGLKRIFKKMKKYSILRGIEGVIYSLKSLSGISRTSSSLRRT